MHTYAKYAKYARYWTYLNKASVKVNVALHYFT